MSVYKITFSPTGGTQKVANLLAAEFAQTSKTVDLLDDIRETAFEEDDLCLIAMPAFAGRVPSVCEQRMEKLQGNGAKAVLVAVFGNRAIDDTLLDMKELAVARGFVPVAGIEAVAEHSVIRKFGAGRPDAEDVADLKEFACQIKAALYEGRIFADLAVPGNTPHRERSNGPMKPYGGANCNSCGLCVWKCPVRAIPADDPKSVDKEKCISCLRCMAVCPRKARQLVPELLAAMEEKMTPVCSGRKENKLYL